MKYNLGTVRQTYVIMWQENGLNDPNSVKYIFNRSISWGSINFEKWQGIINLLGEEGIKKLLEITDKLDSDVNKLTTTWTIDTDIFTLLEVHSEWDNYKHKNQGAINKRKEELAEEYNAYIRKDKIMNPEIVNKIERDLIVNVKRKFEKHCINIYREIGKTFKLVYEPLVCEYDELKKKLEDEYSKKIREYDKEIKSLQSEIDDNKQKLKRQNFVIDKYHDYINSLEPEEIDKIKADILYGKHEDTRI